jgi:hypothetical protein
VLERGLGLVLGVARQVDLAVLADHRAVGADEDRGIEAPPLRGELGIAEVEADAELLRLLEQRLRFFRGHVALEELRIDLALIIHPPARKERGERELGKHHELRSHGVRVAQQRRHSRNGNGAGVCLVERPELGGGDLKVSSH